MSTYDLTTNSLSPVPSKTVTNLIPAAASLTTSGWSGGQYSSAHILHGTTSLQLTGTASTPEVLSQLNTAVHLIQNHIYYGRIYEYHTERSLTTGGQWQIYWPIAEPYFNITTFGPVNQWNMLSACNNRTNWSTGDYALRVDFNNNQLPGNVWYNGLMLIDLTNDYGSGNEPSADWCDANIPFFTGSQLIKGTDNIKFKTGDILNCPYSGAKKTITLPPGQYQLEVWGGQGGSYSNLTGGLGGYSSGILTLLDYTSVFLYSGGAGSSSSTAAGFNGGGSGISSGRGGGGASDIRLGQDSLYARVIVAGGGGGAGVTANTNPAGCGGGIYGGDGYYNYTDGSTAQKTGQNRCGGGGGPTYAGITWNTSSSASFGNGSNASGYSCGGGGGGWYGGAGAYDNDSDSDGRYGGGGSGYVYTSSTASNYPSGCLLNSSYYLDNAQTLDGKTQFDSPSGTRITGNNGNGYARITILRCDANCIKSIWYKSTTTRWNKII